MITKFKTITLIMTLTIATAIAYYGITYKTNGIREVSYPQDMAAIDALFHKDDNWYWMISNGSLNTYSIEHTIHHRSSSQYSQKNDLIIRVMEKDNKIIGLTAYYPKSSHLWQFLFLIVDQEYRKQGIAKQLLSYALADMKSRKALKVDLVTRIENEPAQKLYKKFGFVQIGTTNEHAIMTYKVS